MFEQGVPEERVAEIATFVDQQIAPHAAAWDRTPALPAELRESLASRGYLASFLPEAFGGSAFSMSLYGTLHEEIGQSCTSVRSLLTVHDMVAYAIFRWGTDAQQQMWLPPLASGEKLAAFALSEPEVGSDADGIQTLMEKRPEGFSLTGSKRWITNAQQADLFLVFARAPEGPTAVLVDRATRGLDITPITDIMGARAAGLGELTLDGCPIDAKRVVGGPGRGVRIVATDALTLGRYSVACGCVGMAQACLDLSMDYARRRKQFGELLRKHQLIRRLLTNMVVDTSAARLLCRQAGAHLDRRSPASIIQTAVAKYAASRAAMDAASSAVQIHGASGCLEGQAVERFFRDAKIMEIIEGTTQIHQLMIAQYGMQDHTRRRRARRTQQDD